VSGEWAVDPACPALCPVRDILRDVAPRKSAHGEQLDSAAQAGAFGTTGSLHIPQLLCEPPGGYLNLQVDLLLAQSEYHRQALVRRMSTRRSALDLGLFALACEDLVPHKLLAGRLLHLADAAMFLRANRADRYLEYGLGWTSTPSLGTELAQVWAEAFPGEAIKR
jgi:hypothetical protein